MSLSGADMTTRIQSVEVVALDVDKIRFNTYNANEMPEDRFLELVENMRREGQNGTDPIQVRPIKEATS